MQMKEEELEGEEVIPYHTLYTKANPKCIRDLDVKV